MEQNPILASRFRIQMGVLTNICGWMYLVASEKCKGREVPGRSSFEIELLRRLGIESRNHHHV